MTYATRNGDRRRRAPSPFLNADEAAQWLRVKKSTLRKWVCYNRIPYIKVGRLVAFRREDLETWLNQNNPQMERWLALREAYEKL